MFARINLSIFIQSPHHLGDHTLIYILEYMTVPTQAVKDPPSALSRRPSSLTGRYLEAEPELKRFGLLIYDSRGRSGSKAKLNRKQSYLYH